MRSASGDPLFSLPAVITPLVRIRSTLLVASIAAIRRRGDFDAYSRALCAEHRAALLESVAGTWLSADAASAHYDACDALALTEEQEVAIGRSVAQELRGTLTGAMAYIAKQSGVTPWTVLPQLPRFWGRIFDGSALGVSKLGPKEARIDVLGMPLCRSHYFRNALRGQGMAVLNFFATRTYMSELRTHARQDSCSLRAQWV